MTKPLVTLVRYYTPLMVWGDLYVEPKVPKNGYRCRTIERPWEDNKQNVSCIPEGEYPMRMRPSNVVSDTTDKEFTEGWEVCGVPNRSLIMVHVGNYARDVEGCIAVGRSFGVIHGRVSVSSSRETFRELMAALSVADEWTLRVEQWRPRSGE